MDLPAPPAPPFGVIIPARYGSTRLPGKPMRRLAGKPMVLHVLDRALESGASWVVVATDDDRIARAVRDAGGDAVLTSPSHLSGTDRIAEVAARRQLDPATIVVNLQGDEPLIAPALVATLASALAAHASAALATVATPIRDRAELFDPNVVKVVTDHADFALYFSRAPIPWTRSWPALGSSPPNGLPDDPLPDDPQYLRHIGLYSYTVGTLLHLARSSPAPPEKLESLEQLRALWLGLRIHVTTAAEPPGHGVDTEEDLARTERLLVG